MEYPLSVYFWYNFPFCSIFVDWSEGSSSLTHGTAAARAEPVSIIVSSQLNFMRSMGFINFDQVQIIGFSLGGLELIIETF